MGAMVALALGDALLLAEALAAKHMSVMDLLQQRNKNIEPAVLPDPRWHQ